MPLILRQPNRIAAKQYYTKPVGTVDLTPTVMGLLNLLADPNDQGRDLSAVLADTTTKPLENEAGQDVTFLRNAGKTAQWVAAVDSRYKLILSTDDVPWLFDAKEDPDELQNFYGKPDTAAVSKRLGLALQMYGVDNKDPHLKNVAIAGSLTAVLLGK